MALTPEQEQMLAALIKAYRQREQANAHFSEIVGLARRHGIPSALMYNRLPRYFPQKDLEDEQ